jgi:SAM-dependent methyltransferase
MHQVISNQEFQTVNKCHVCRRRAETVWVTTSYGRYLRLRPDIKIENDPLETDKKILDFPIDLIKCDHCHFIFTSPRVKTQKLKEIYGQSASYFTSYDDTASPAHLNRRKTFTVEIIRISKLAKGKSILDIGCGGGFFLDELGPKWKRVGVEIDPGAVKFARKLLGKNVPIIHANLENADLPSNSFDVIIIRGTIEHVPNPRQTLKTILSLLKPDGLVAINTPNIDSFAAKIYRQNFRLVDPIHHIWYFSPSTITRLLNEVGFTPPTIDFNYFNTPYFRFSDISAVGFNWLKFLLVGKRPETVSPPFYGNIMDVYARKGK